MMAKHLVGRLETVVDAEEKVTGINAAEAPAVNATEAPQTLVGPATSVLDASQARIVRVGGAAAEAQQHET